jgi:hypothetical protein
MIRSTLQKNGERSPPGSRPNSAQCNDPFRSGHEHPITENIVERELISSIK